MTTVKTEGSKIADNITHSIGNYYEVEGYITLLAKVDDNKVILVCLEDGNRWGPPEIVNNLRNISTEEIIKIFDREINQIRYIPNITISY